MPRTVSVGLVLALAGCGSAMVVQQTPQGGTLELSGDQGKAMEDANNKMSAQCGPNDYTIVLQGYEPVSTTTTPQATGARTPQVWRVHYQCNGATPSGN